MLRKVCCVALLALGLCFSGCTEPGETTGIAAATGGAIGAGIGAIIGNQTGGTASGLALGAVAGSATGAMVGNAIESKEKQVNSQEEMLARQEQTLQAQRRELEGLKRVKNDYTSKSIASAVAKSNPVRPSSYTRSSGLDYSKPRERDLIVPAAPQPQIDMALDRKPASITQNDRLLPADSIKDARAGISLGAVRRSAEAGGESLNRLEDSMNDVNSKEIANTQSAVAAISANSFEADECKKAQDEAAKAERSSEFADKLYHYRRSIRFCPQEPSFHNALGEVYASMNRTADADYEFNEALNLNPNFSAARSNLDRLGSSNRY